MHAFSILFLGLVVIDSSLRLWLNWRQCQAIRRGRKVVPTAFATHISLRDHHQAADYNLAKLQLGRWQIMVNAALILALTVGGGIDELAQQFNWLSYPVTSQVSLILGYGLVNALIGIPFKLYATFKIEQQFGFNQMTVKLFMSDLIKGTLVGAIIGVPLLYLIMGLMNNLGTSWWLWVWLVIVAFNLLILIVYPTLIAPLFNKFTPLADAELSDKIHRLGTECGFNLHAILVMDGSKRTSHGNAYFTGLGASKRIVFFDTLLKQLNHQEIIAVLAHELGHFKHKHILKQMLISFGLMLAGLFSASYLLEQTWFYHGLNVTTINHGSGLLLLFIFFEVISLALAPSFSFLSRRNEYEADNFASTHSNSQDLISGLVKLYRDNASTLTPDSLYVAFYYSHPPANLRIANLEGQQPLPDRRSCCSNKH